MQLIDLSHFNTDYRHRRDIETAIAWNAVKKTLITLGREELFDYIKSVKVTEKNIIIITEKPIVNAEIKLYGEKILLSVNTGLKTIRSLPRSGMKLR